MKLVHVVVIGLILQPLACRAEQATEMQGNQVGGGFPNEPSGLVLLGAFVSRRVFWRLHFNGELYSSGCPLAHS